MGCFPSWRFIDSKRFGKDLGWPFKDNFKVGFLLFLSWEKEELGVVDADMLIEPMVMTKWDGVNLWGQYLSKKIALKCILKGCQLGQRFLYWPAGCELAGHMSGALFIVAPKNMFYGLCTCEVWKGLRI